MVAIITGNGNGIDRSSLSVLGAAGQLGQARVGQAGRDVYVNASTGNLAINTLDEFLVGRGPDAAVNLDLNSLLGGTASYSFAIGLRDFTGTPNTAGSTVTRWAGDSAVYTYDAGRGAYVSREGGGAYDEIRFANNVWSWTDGDTGLTEYYEYSPFAGKYNLTRSVDADGNTLTRTYSGNMIQTMATANGETISFEWADGKIVGINEINVAGVVTRKTRLTWDTVVNFRLASITVDLTPADGSIADGNVHVTSFTYDGSSRRVASMTQSDGSRIDVTYVLVGSDYRVATLTEAETASAGRTTSFSYDTANRVTTVTDATGQATQLWYDAQNQLTKIVSPPATSGAAPQTQLFAYNANGDLISVTDPAGGVTTFQYDSNGNEIWRQDSLGNVVTRTYGAKNELLSETRHEGGALSFTTSGSAPAVTGNKVVGVAWGSWGSATTSQSYTGSAFVSARRLHPWNGYSFLGLTDGPLSASAPYNDYDYAYYFHEDSIRIWENGAHIDVPVPSGVSDNLLCEIEYDGAKVVYRIGGTVVREVATSAGRTFRAGASTQHTDRGVQDFTFAARAPETTRFVYDAENHVRYRIGAEGNVTEYRYTAAGEVEYQIEYPDQAFSGSPAGVLFASASFETPEIGTGYQYNPSLPGMTFSGNSGITGNNSAFGFVAAPDGDQVAFVQSVASTGGSIAQALTGLTAGAQYSVKFRLAARPATGGTPVTVSFNGTVLGTFSPSTIWFEEFSATFTATGSTGTLTFSTPAAAGDRSTAIDKVRIAALPMVAHASFEAPEIGSGYQYNPSIAGTTFSPASGIAGNGSAWGFAAAPDGDQVAFIQTAPGGAGSITQKLSGLVPQTTYTVKFFIAARPGYGGTPVTVSYNGTSLGTFDPASTAFQEITVSFVATGPTGTLSLAGAPTSTDRATAVDNLRVMGAGSSVSEADLDHWRNGLGDLSSTMITQYTYNARGSLSSVTAYGAATAAGSATTAEGYSRTDFVYDPAGRLLSRMVEGQRAETFVYDGLGRLIASTDRHQGTTSIAFNHASSQTVVTLASGLVTTSTYNKAGDLVSVAQSGSYIPSGATTTNKYDKLGQLRMTTDATGFNTYFVYDKVGRMVAEVNHRGDMTEYRYDSNDRLVATARYTQGVTAANMAVLADPNATFDVAAVRPAWHPWDIWSWRTYDKEGRLTSIMDSTIRTFEYDSSGRLIKSVAYQNWLDWGQILAFQSNPPTAPYIPPSDPRDVVERNFYDKAGRLIAALDGEGYLTRNVYDRAGRLIERIAYATATAAADRLGPLSKLLANQVSHADDRVAHFVYDGQGQLRFEVDALNQVTEYRYNAAGQSTSTIRHAGSIPAPADYRLATVKALVASLSASPGSAASRRSWSVYDEGGRVAYSIGAEGAVTRFSYDTMGQVTKAVEFAAVRPTTSAPDLVTMNNWAAGQNGNAANRVTRHYYSARGELRYTVDGEGYVSRTDFDAAGRTVGEFRWDDPFAIGDSSTIDNVATATNNSTRWAGKWYGYQYGGPLTDFRNGENNWVAYAYYQNGTQMYEYAPYADANPTYFNYDIWGRVASRSDTGASYGYDGLGNQSSFTDGRNYTTTRTFDHLGRVKTETDAAGGVVSYEYNAFGEVTKVTDARGNATVSTYDKLGRLLTTTDALNNVTSYTYNEFGEVKTVTRGAAVTSFDYDRAGRVTRTTDAEGYYEEYTLDAFGNRINVRNKIGGIVTNAFDRRGLLVAETLPMASYDNWGNVVAWSVTNKFEYDGRRNQTKKIEAFGLAEQRTTTYYYDKADRLVETAGDYVQAIDQASHSALSWVIPSEKFKYDQRGRVIEHTDALGARTLYYYDALGRVSVELRANGLYTAFTYDVNGNMLSQRAYATAVALPATPGGAAPAAPGGEYRETSFTYDALNRLKTTTVANVRTGAWNGSYYATGVGSVTTTFDYDANGNVIKTTDGNGGTTFAFYDKLNRTIASVDAENYLTFYTLDGEGNVTQEERFAARLGFGVSTAHDAAWLRSTVAGNAGDRITQFGYDKNGRRTSEWRLYINSNYVSGNSLGVDGVHGGIQYHYNGLGQVWQKTFGNGDYVSFAYDSMGRLTQESRAPFTDQNGASVRPTTFYFYDGLNNLTLSRQGGVTQAGGDRLTRYAYGAGGRMTAMTDATGNTYNYYYDAAGNVLRENYTRTKSDGTSATEGMLYTRDILGRVTSQALATWNGSWAKGDRQDTEYNVYGDVSRRGINGGWQEQFAYDGAGRVWRSNSGDGVWRFFVHDANGNQTLTIESEGANLAGYTLDQALSAATAGGAYYVGGAYIDGINSTINVFDKRGQAVQTRMPQRQLNDTAAATGINVSRTYTAFGEVASETDARGFTTDYTYNTMGRLIEKRSPAVSYTTESGAVGSARPTEYYYYDRAGRLIGSRDANGNLTTRSLLAGTGHDGSEALVTYEYHSDGGYLRNDYDVFGDKRVSWDEIGRRTDMAYDAMGRVTQITRPSGLVDYYAYDLLGQRIQHWNNVLGDREYTDYDLQGRVTRQVAFGGDTTTTSYAWNGGIATLGMGTFGGWTETITLANGRSSTEQTDVFGRQIYKSDLGGHVYNFSYDLAGRMTQRAGTETLTYTWLNTGKVAQSFSMTGTYGDDYTRKGTTYGYDASGNLTSERFTEEGQQTTYWWNPYDYAYESYTNSWSRTYKNATASYDALNRIVTWAEAGSADMAAASTSYAYDLVGNIRRSNSLYRAIDNNGAQTAYDFGQDNWYRYDSMNRLVTKGSLVGGQIVRGTTGADYFYDKAGQRVSALRTTQDWATVYDPYYYYDPYYGYGNPYVTVAYDAEVREDYTYDGNGALTSVRIAQGGYTDNGDGTVTPNAAPAYAALKASFTNDLMGRVTRQIDWLGDGANAGYDRSVTLNAKGQVTNETVVSKQGADTISTSSSHDYGSGSGYALGGVVSTYATTYKNGGYQSYSSTTNGYAWFEGAVQSSITTTTTTYSPSYSSTTHSTSLTYDGSGSLSSIYVGDGRPRSITFVNDANGQTIKRDEADNNYNQYTGGDPHEIWHRFGGKQMGYVGNNGTLDTDYQTSIGNRTRTPGTGAFRFGTSYGSMTANFDLSGDAINSYGQGVSAGGYTIRQGDTLQAIAANLWGDSSLWYKLAEANGMSGAQTLMEGQKLIIPAGVMKSRHNASTFRPFDPSETLGDISPTTPQPQKATKKGGKCGIIGTILVIAIAVAVTALLRVPVTGFITGALSGAGVGAGAAAVGGAIIGGAVAGAAGSIASQAFGVAAGIQDKFSWKGVATAAISGGVAGGMSKLLPMDQLLGSKFLMDAARGAATNVTTQGITVALGLQKKFDWVGVAAAGMSSAAAGTVGRALPGSANPLLNTRASFGNLLASNTAGGIAGAATRTLLNGSDFGDNLLAVLPDVIGSTIGQAVADAVRSESDAARMRRAHRVVRRWDADGELRPGPSALSAQALNAVAAQRGISISDAAADPELRDAIMDFGRSAQDADPEVRAAGAERLLTEQLGYSREDVAAARRLAAPLVRDFSRPAQFLGLDPETIVVTGTSPSRVASVLGRIGHFIEDHGNNRWVQGAAFIIGAVAAPISTAFFTLISYTPGVGDVVRNVEATITRKAMDFGVEAVSRFGVSRREAPYVVIGGLTVLGLAVFGGRAVRFARNAFDSARAHFARSRGPDGPPSFNFSSLPATIARQRQERHILGSRLYAGRGGYLRSLDEAQEVLDAARGGNATFVGMHKDGPVVRFDGVTGYNHNPRSGFPHQPTNLFYLKGSDRVSVVPMSPDWRPRP
ncbi:MAG TPA: LysM peptidoglycan-binding domain-containing protein [Allosphingosinicella sp.]